MKCKSHLHLGKFKNFLLRSFLITQDFRIFPVPYGNKQNCNGEMCLDRRQSKAEGHDTTIGV